MGLAKLHYGCGPSAVEGWLNYDASPTLRLQRLFLLGRIFRKLLPPLFDKQIQFGDVAKLLPLDTGSIQFTYCSHVLEHLTLDDCRAALRETYRTLKPGGIFRGVLPDLEYEINQYRECPSHQSSLLLMESTLLGLRSRPKGFNGLLRFFLGNARHLWMWDYKGLAEELTLVGFTDVRRARFGDSEFKVFEAIENPTRWKNALGFECRKPLPEDCSQ